MVSVKESISDSKKERLDSFFFCFLESLASGETCDLSRLSKED